MTIEDLVFSYRNARTTEEYTEVDRANFAKVYDATKPSFIAIVRLAKKKFSKMGINEDGLTAVVDEAFIKCIEKYEGRNGAKFTSFLTKSVFNLLKDMMRKNTRENSYLEDLDLSPQTTTFSTNVDYPMSIELKDQARSLLSKLSSRQRLVVELYTRGFKFEEIARMLGRPNSKGRISVDYHDAIEMLKKLDSS